MQHDTPGASRRTVLKGAAWSVPVVAIATSAPLAAASVFDDVEFFITAFELTGVGASSGSVRANGIRISPKDPMNPRIVPAGTTYTITIAYNGALGEAFSFRNTANGIDYQLSLLVGPGRYDSATINDHSIVLVWTNPFNQGEPTAPDINWDLGPIGSVVRPENDSVSISAVANIVPGGDFPNGGVLSPLVVDPNQGTGTLSGPDNTTWAP